MATTYEQIAGNVLARVQEIEAMVIGTTPWPDLEALAVERDTLRHSLGILREEGSEPVTVPEDRSEAPSDPVLILPDDPEVEDILRGMISTGTDAMPKGAIRSVAGIDDPELTRALRRMLDGGLLRKRGNRRATVYAPTAKARKLAT